ncbi:hypothetical protein NLI96_g4429 [Meripilus lineatus]|uniref:Secreted RxLR effector peptide protein n=1 Tax=Meripilus lineatus TaxID=2056292 RepID=A0AAD5V4W2_9APHY|nr:hypothetical protein NLI96_g4429 [Physisporinus lineatus]
MKFSLSLPVLILAGLAVAAPAPTNPDWKRQTDETGLDNALWKRDTTSTEFKNALWKRAGRDNALWKRDDEPASAKDETGLMNALWKKAFNAEWKRGDGTDKAFWKRFQKVSSPVLLPVFLSNPLRFPTVELRLVD